MSDESWMESLRKDPLVEKAEAAAAQAERQKFEAQARAAQEAVDRRVQAFPRRFEEMKEQLKKNAPIKAQAGRDQAEGGRRPSLLPAQRDKQEMEARFTYARGELEKRADAMREVVGDRAVGAQFKQLTFKNEWNEHLGTIEKTGGFRERAHYESEAEGVVLSPVEVSDIEATKNAKRIWYEGIHGPSRADIDGFISVARKNGNWPLPKLHTGPGSTPQLDGDKYQYSTFKRDCEATGRVNAAQAPGHQVRAEAEGAPPQRFDRDLRNADVEQQRRQPIRRLQALSERTPIARPAQPSHAGRLQKPFQDDAAPSAPLQTKPRSRLGALLTRAVGGVARWISDMRSDSSTRPGGKTGVDRAAMSDATRGASPRATEDAPRDRTQGVSVQIGQARQIRSVAVRKPDLDKPLPPIPAKRTAFEQSADGSRTGRREQDAGRRQADLSRYPTAVVNVSRTLAGTLQSAPLQRDLARTARFQLLAARDGEDRTSRIL